MPLPTFAVLTIRTRLLFVLGDDRSLAEEVFQTWTMSA